MVGGGRAFPARVFCDRRPLSCPAVAYRIAPTLQEARVNLIDLDLCNSTQWYNGRIRSTNACAGYPEGKIDTCQVTSLRVPRSLPTPVLNP